MPLLRKLSLDICDASDGDFDIPDVSQRCINSLISSQNSLPYHLFFLTFLSVIQIATLINLNYCDSLEINTSVTLSRADHGMKEILRFRV